MSNLFAGVDLGGTATKAAIADDDGNVLVGDSIPTQAGQGPDAVLQRIVQLVETLSAKVGNEAAHRIAGIGIGIPGLVDRQNAVTKFLPNLPTQWRDIPVGTILNQHFGCPVRILNDARMATLGELKFGHGKNLPNVTLAFFSIGTGVGGGLAIDGRLRLGPMGAAGELGHQTIITDGPKCGCGNRGCLETLASGSAIAAEGRRLMKSGLAPKLSELVDGDATQVSTLVMAKAAEQDIEIREAIIRAAKYLGVAAANVVAVLHPDMVVLGGGVAGLGDLLIDAVRDTIRDRVGMFPTEDVVVTRSSLGSQAGVMGAIALAQNELDC